MNASSAGKRPQAEPRLTRSDVWLITTLITGSPHPTLPDLLSQADYLNRALLTFDEISFGFPRLVAAGYAVVGRSSDGVVYFEATAKARSRVGLLRRRLGSIDLMLNLMRSLARPYPESEDEDRSLGRLANVDETVYEAAVRAAGYR